eukprot:gnl/Chilomastix_caulleri/5517.p2 GENE.gnl/Chilomastix_caulleri/5517~~gnl/Chilomastix_caulleri/5517.p2  ORF type:complete len:51 (-),score=3.90 gnl/Chilomastix_caulleri/5517:60-212(-)
MNCEVVQIFTADKTVWIEGLDGSLTQNLFAQQVPNNFSTYINKSWVNQKR